MEASGLFWQMNRANVWRAPIFSYWTWLGDHVSWVCSFVMRVVEPLPMYHDVNCWVSSLIFEVCHPTLQGTDEEPSLPECLLYITKLNLNLKVNYIFRHDFKNYIIFHIFSKGRNCKSLHPKKIISDQIKQQVFLLPF